jgi:molybdopterin-guanine dinucleotide biosynthesis protein A
MTGAGSTGRFDVVVLAGGGARRLSGRDKPGLVIGGRPLIESVIAAGAGAARVIVVGPRRDGLDGVIFVSEDPPGAGPVPALRRGLAEVTAPQVAVLAADLPFLRARHIQALLGATATSNGAVLADDDGREQWLAGCWQTATLRAALDAYQGASLGGLLRPLEPALLELAEPGEPPPWLDCDTPGDVETASALSLRFPGSPERQGPGPRPSSR